MLENRYKKTIVEFSRSLPNPELIQAASTDMYRPYREAIQEVLPHVVHVVNKYHIIRMGNEALEAVRRRMKDTHQRQAESGLEARAEAADHASARAIR